jgi:hypothetical protein
LIKPFLISEPWGTHTEIDRSLTFSDENFSLKISGSGTPRIIGNIDLAPRYGTGQRKLLPKTSFPFRWKDEICMAFQLPLNCRPKKELHDFLVNVHLGGVKHEIVQTEVIGRPGPDHKNELGRKLDSFIEWQLNCFRELANQNANISVSSMEEKSRNIVRRNWNSVRKTWVRYDKDKAYMALIVEMAQNKDLLRLFQSIVGRPRQILQRYRENTPIQKIQEIDSVCIIDLARRPGRTVAEKAGSRQELLAVRRRSYLKTLENCVFQWVLKRMLERAQDYVETNKHLIHIGSDKVPAVRKCGRLCKKWTKSDTLKTVTSDHLQHPITPNYTLQMDQRYRFVYRTYRKLLKEEHVRDDAWEWQRSLWGESARQLVGATLTQFFSEERASTPYYRSESEYGIWTQTPVGAGPFLTKAGPCILIDSRDVLANVHSWIQDPPFDFAPYLGTVGCDQVLFWPEKETLLSIWFIYWTGRSEDIVPMLERASESLEILSLDIRRFSRTAYKCLGLLLVTDPQSESEKPGVEIEPWPPNSQFPRLVSVQIPFTISQTSSEEFKGLIEDFETGIQLVVDTAIKS